MRLIGHFCGDAIQRSIFVDSGITGQASAFGATYVVPVGIGAALAVLPNLDVGAEFALPNAVTGMKGDNSTDLRVLGAFVSYRMK